MTDYRLLSAETVRKLNEEVSKYLKEDWQVHGSPFAFGMHNTPALICQAVVKLPESEIVEQLAVPHVLAENGWKHGYDS